MSGAAPSIEVERKFRVLVGVSQLTAGWDALAAWEIWQGYFSPIHAAVEVRVRRVLQLALDHRDDFYPAAEHDELGQQNVRHLLTVKREISSSSAVGVSRHEVETSVEPSFFDEAWAACEGRRLRKIRVEFMAQFAGAGPRIVAVDRFRERLEGLVVAELEFDAWQQARDFQAPDVLGREVTRDPRFRNSTLASTDAPPEVASG